MAIKRIAFFIVIIASIVIINNLVNSIYTLLQKKDLLVSSQQSLDKEKQENQELQKKLAQASKAQFVEEEARNKLFLAKPGEDIVIVPTSMLAPSPSVTPPPHRQNWEKWIDLFFPQK
ncbi:MAG: septum formation initiator family protein [Patescibacteria group bacterium]